jgi:hypothetical protein
MAKTHVFKFPFSNLVFVGTIQNQAANGPGSTLYANTSTGYGGQGSVLVVTSVTSGGNNIQFTPPTAPIAATAMVAGLTYIIQTLGTTDYTLCGSPSNNIGQAFTATVAGIGTGTVMLSMDSLLLNCPGVPPGTHIVGQAPGGTAGGVGSYYLDNVNPIYIPNGTSMTQGRHFRNQVSAIASFPESITEGIQTIVVNQFKADTGSVAAVYVQGSVDGGQNWVNVSGALALTTAAPNNSYQSSASAAYTAYDSFRILNGTVTGLASVGGTLRAMNLFNR